MNRLLSLILSLADEIIPYFKPSNRSGFISLVLIISANSIPVIGVIFFKWNPYIILLIYWGESLIIGIFNIFKMIISGTIQDHKFSPGGFAEGAGLSLFFTFHYGMFMFVHGAFILLFLVISSTAGNVDPGALNNPFAAINLLSPWDMTPVEFIESEFSAVAALFVSHFVSFYIYFIRTGEYNYTKAEYYMLKPYKRIVVMHLTIIFGAFALFITGFKSVVFIIIWIGLKILADLKMQVSEIKNYRGILK